MQYWFLMGSPETGPWVAGKFNTFKEAVKCSYFNMDSSWSRNHDKKWRWKRNRWWNDWIEILPVKD